MKVATALLILLPAAAADSQSFNEARSENSNLRGGGGHSHKGHSLLEEFRQQRAHKKDIEDDADIVTDSVGISVGPGKYSDPVDDEKNPTRKSTEGHSAIFRTSRLSRGEMEKRAHEMEAQLQQVKDGTLELNEKTIDRYQKFVDRYNELEKEIYALNHPEEKEPEDANTSNDTTASDAKKLTSAYSSGKAEYEKSIKEMKEKKEIKEINLLMLKDVPKTNNDVTVAETQEEGRTGKAADIETTSKYVYAADGTKQLKINDDDEINQLPEKPEKINELDLQGSATDDDDVPSNFEGLEEGKISSKSAIKVSNASFEAEEDDDIPPNFEGLEEGKISPKVNDEASKDDIDQSDDEAKHDENFSNTQEPDGGSGAHDNIVVQGGAKDEEDEETGIPRDGDKNEVSSEVDVKNSLEKVKKLADAVSTTEEALEKNTGKEDTEQASVVPEKIADIEDTEQAVDTGDVKGARLVDDKLATISLNIKEVNHASEDAGTDEIEKSFLPNLDAETSEGQKSTERGMNEDKTVDEFD